MATINTSTQSTGCGQNARAMTGRTAPGARAWVYRARSCRSWRCAGRLGRAQRGTVWQPRASSHVAASWPAPSSGHWIRLHQVVVRRHDAVVDYREVLAAGGRLVVDTVTRINACECRVALAAGGPVAMPCGSTTAAIWRAR
ncbi:hypothetical protein [Streptomyces sp. NPDC048269]|uniref:hypothetical protein n=1 Tax=Streptomyces sp. NPDC048269 TaxID=3155753 RepID=UPI003446499D